jgi:hypothetical protein
MKYSFVVTGLALLVLANILIVYQFVSRENFQGAMPPPMNNKVPNMASQMAAIPMAPSGGQMMPGGMNSGPSTMTEGFSSFLLSEAAGAKDKYQSMGAYDGVQLSTGNNVSVWRYTSPNEKLLGDKFTPGDDNLFMFKNNQCKPECCGASFSCGGGCVCTTPEQRDYIAGRGGNRTAPEDSA